MWCVLLENVNMNLMHCSNVNDIVQDLPLSIQIQRCIDLCRILQAKETETENRPEAFGIPKRSILCDVYMLQPEEVYAETSGLKTCGT